MKLICPLSQVGARPGPEVEFGTAVCLAASSAEIRLKMGAFFTHPFYFSVSGNTRPVKLYELQKKPKTDLLISLHCHSWFTGVSRWCTFGLPSADSTLYQNMMMSWYGNAFCIIITGPLREKSIGYRQIPPITGRWCETWCFLGYLNNFLNEQSRWRWIVTPLCPYNFIVMADEQMCVNAPPSGISVNPLGMVLNV